MRPEQERTEAIVRSHGCDSAKLIAILQEIQATENYLSQENMTLVADMLGISVARVYSVATFYENFSLDPRASTLSRSATARRATSASPGRSMTRYGSIWGWRASARPRMTPCSRWKRWPVSARAALPRP